MAIVNRTNDSFWSGNRHGDLASARRALDAAVELGADIVDVGGVRAGQEGEVVTPEQEIERVVPFLARAREDHPDLVLSLDTWRSEVARVAAAEAGLDLVNDTWAGHDRDLVHVAARAGAGYVISHTGGLPPRTDPVGVTYPPEPLGVLDDALRTLREGAERAVAAGIPAERVLVDPTLDFGKTTAHSLTLLRHTAAIVGAGLPGAAGALAQGLRRRDPRPAGRRPARGHAGRHGRRRVARAPRCSGRTTCGPPGGSSTWWRRSGVTGRRCSRCAGSPR